MFSLMLLQVAADKPPMTSPRNENSVPLQWLWFGTNSIW